MRVNTVLAPKGNLFWGVLKMESGSLNIILPAEIWKNTQKPIFVVLLLRGKCKKTMMKSEYLANIFMFGTVWTQILC